MYCPILIILSLLQTEINCDQVYLESTTPPKSASALPRRKMNKNGLVNVAAMIS